MTTFTLVHMNRTKQSHQNFNYTKLDKCEHNLKHPKVLLSFFCSFLPFSYKCVQVPPTPPPNPFPFPSTHILFFSPNFYNLISLFLRLHETEQLTQQIDIMNHTIQRERERATELELRSRLFNYGNYKSDDQVRSKGFLEESTLPASNHSISN